jgi:DNA polymerase-1
MIVVLDFETNDPWIRLGRGSGWPERQAKFLCAATHDSLHGMMYCSDMAVLKVYLDGFQDLTIVAHNAQYEAGVLHSYGFDIRRVTWIDTMILAKLFYNNLLDFSLDGLAKRYLGETKDDYNLGHIAKELGLVKTIAQNPVKIAKENMEKVFERSEETVKDYVIQDVNLTLKLFNYFFYDEEKKERFTREVVDFHSDLIKALVLSRARGVRVHLPTARKIKEKLTIEKVEIEKQIVVAAPGVNINSSKQLAEFFTAEGVEFNTTDKGNPSITKSWLDETDHPLGKLINRCKRLDKLVRDFIDPLLEFVEDGQEFLKVYPEIKIYGAAATGRASCSNPNLQQVPKRDEEGQLVRTMYFPFEGDDWVSLDFSAQEPRLQVHYAAKIGAPGADLLVAEFKKNIRHDLHQQVADLAQISRKDAKTINLGLAYGMGDAKLAKSLKLTFVQAKQLKNKFNKMVPFLDTLNRFVKGTIKSRGYINSLGGRKLYNEQGFEQKALNKLIQGGSADQTWKAIVECYRAGILILFPVHDSLELSLSNVEDIKKVKHIMETCADLLVPSYADPEIGQSWGTLQPLSIGG